VVSKQNDRRSRPLFMMSKNFAIVLALPQR
jgi:hypothetical protein